MLNKFDLQREVCTLDLLIRAISFEMAREPRRDGLFKEMEEALCRLRQERGLRKILLIALENELSNKVDRKQAARVDGLIAA